MKRLVHVAGRIDPLEAEKAAAIMKKSGLTSSELLRILYKRGLHRFNWRHYARLKKRGLLVAMGLLLMGVGHALAQSNVLIFDTNSLSWVIGGVPQIEIKGNGSIVTNIDIPTNYTGTISIGQYVFRESDIKSETIFGTDMGQTWPMGNRLVLTIATNAVTMTNWVTVTNQVSAPTFEPLTTNWIGCPVVDDNNRYTPTMGWMPQYIYGLRSDGVMVWKTNNAPELHGL